MDIGVLVMIWAGFALVDYLLIGFFSKTWHVEGKDLVILIPVVNMVVFLLVLIIITEDWLLNRKYLDIND